MKQMVDNFKTKMFKGKEGFTLIEMLVVIAMIGILSAVVLTALGPSREKAMDARIISDVNQARAIAEGYYDPTSGDYNMTSINSAIGNTGTGSDASGTVLDANKNYGATGNCGGNALCVVPDSGSSANFAVYGELNIGGPDTWFCSDSNGKTEQKALPASTDPSSDAATYQVCP